MEKVDLGVAFQPLAFLSAIGKNIVNFLTPGPAIFPKVTQVATTLPTSSLADILAQPVLDLKLRPSDSWINIPSMETYAAEALKLSELPIPGSIPTTVTTGNIFTTIWDTLKGPAETFLDFFLTKGKLEAAASIAQSQADSQRAVQAVVEAQERAIATQTQQQKETQGILSTEAWRKAAPYVIPIATGLAIVALLLVVKKGDKKKK